MGGELLRQLIELEREFRAARRLTVQGLSPETGGIRVIYPNLSYEKPGARADFWRYDPREKGWYVYGQGHASAEGKQIVPDRGVEVYDSIGFMYTPGTGAPPAARAPPCLTCPKPKEGADPVDLYSGLFLHRRTDIDIRDVVPAAIVRTYRPGDTVVRAFGYGTAHTYSWYIYFPGPDFTLAAIIKPDGGRIPLTRISPGTDWSNAVFENQEGPAPFYKARMDQAGLSRIWSLRLLDGTVMEFDGFAGAELMRVSDRVGNAIEIARNGGRITRITTPSGRFLDFTYDASNRITEIEDIGGRTATYEYNAAGHLAKATDPNGKYEEYTYDAAGQMLTVKDRRGNTMVTNQYDANGRVSQQTLADSGVYRFAYTLDGSGNVTRTDMTNPRGHLERVEFNAFGGATSHTLAYGTALAQTTTYEYVSGQRQLAAMVDPLNRRTEYGYDLRGNVTSVTRLAGTGDAVTETMTYTEEFNQLASYKDALNHETTYGYDWLGRLIEAKDPLGNTTRFEYGEGGQVSRIVDPRGQATDLVYQSYDLRSVTDPLARTLALHTDILGRTVASTDPLGQLWRYEYDPLSRLTKVIDPHGQHTVMTYDNNGNLTSVTDARGALTEFGYDAKNRRTSRKDPLLKTETFEYDGNDNLTRHTDRKGQVTGFSYDALDRRTQAGFGATPANPTAYTSTIDYSYDAGQRLTQAVDSVAGTISRTFDGLDRLSYEITPQGRIDYGYDAASRRTSATVQGQAALTYSFDHADRLTGITQSGSTVALSYDAASRRTTLTLPNGLSVDYGYDNANQLTSLTYRNGATVLGDLTYAYDAAGRRTQVGGSYARTSLPAALASATFDANNRLTDLSGQGYSYDDNGNLVSDGVRSYTWNARNQLSALGGSVTASFQYDALGRRLSKTVGGITTRYLYDGLNAVQEQDGSGTPTANFVAGPNLDEWYLRSDAAGARYLLADALGSSIALADSAGTIQTSYTYEPYGETTASGSASANPLKYTGREDDGTGLYYYRARYYQPGIKRFVTEDPIGLAGGPNLYTYVEGDPIASRDPLGLQVDPFASPTIPGHDPFTGEVYSGQVGDVNFQQNAEAWVNTQTVVAGVGATIVPGAGVAAVPAKNWVYGLIIAIAPLAKEGGQIIMKPSYSFVRMLERRDEIRRASELARKLWDACIRP